MEEGKPIINISGLKNCFGDQVVHEDLNLSVYPNEIVAIIGESGCGKTTLLRSILLLQKPSAGEIEVFGTNVLNAGSKKVMTAVQNRWGMMFQSGALFSSLTVLENIMFPVDERAKLYQAFEKEIALVKLLLVGLPLSAASKYPSELSGGMIKRVALARALVLDPELLFLDEPSAGLDPAGAAALDELLLTLRDQLSITMLMVTHDLDTLWRVPDRVVFLGERRVLAALPMSELVKHPHPSIQAYFANIRAQRYCGQTEEEHHG